MPEASKGCERVQNGISIKSVKIKMPGNQRVNLWFSGVDSSFFSCELEFHAQEYSADHEFSIRPHISRL